MGEKGDALDRCNVETMDAKRHRGTRAGWKFIGGKSRGTIKYIATVSLPRSCAGDARVTRGS